MMSAPETVPALWAKDVDHTYHLQGEIIPVLRNLQLSVARGEKVFLIGASGSGKTTLLHIIAGLEAPESGEVRLDGQLLYGTGEKAVSRSTRARIRNQNMGFVFQGYHLLPEFTALENVMMPSIIRGCSSRDEARRLLDFVGLKERERHLPAEMSGGEQQRVAIARSLINSPSILFADEPTGNLDSQNAGQIMNLIFDLVEREKKTLIVVTHDPSLAKQGDRCLTLANGQLNE